MKRRVTIQVETTASIWLTVDDSDVSLHNGVATGQVESDDEIILQWGCIGDPATPYEITLSTEEGASVQMITGKNPYKASIPRSRFTAGGFVRFMIVGGNVHA
jgi:hypothetical protein